MPTTVVRYQTKDDRSDENQQLVEAVFAALHRDQPTGFGYTVLRIADGAFVHIFDIEDGVDDSGFTGLDAFGRFVERIADRVTEPPTLQPAMIVGTYGTVRGD